MKLNSGAAEQQAEKARLLPQNDEADAIPAEGGSGRLSMGWRAALLWASFICVWYLGMQRALQVFVPHDPKAREALLSSVPLHVYRYSEAAFAVATVLNLLNLVFEDTPDKQQLGLLSAVIKGLSWHSDHLLVSGKAIIKFDYHGALILPSRYVQWSCSTPTMIFTLSRISNMDATSIGLTLAGDWLMVVTGYLAAELPWWAGVWALAASFICMGFVLRQLKTMMDDALKEAGSEHARKCLRFTLGSTIVIWSLFPIGWVCTHCLSMPFVAALGEPITMFANFAAKVVFSTSIMYNNYVTLAERRRAARLAAEHSERIQAVHDLSVAVGRKDAFLEVVGHELRTPLNAICQLSAALAVGAGGPLAHQALEWMGTIKASAAHLLGVVNDILTFRAGQAAGLVIKQEFVSVADVVDEVLRTLLPSAGTGITLEKVMHARLPPIVGDRRRLVLAITNLVANSLKFMDKTNGKVTVKAYPDRGGRHVIIKVTDNGAGLTAKQLAQLGDAAMCAQVDSGKRRAGGLGLGLPITFQLIAAHGGVVRMSSPGPGAGTSALIRVPVMQAVTEQSLQQQFTMAYTALGYSMEQLMSPELAASEGRACPIWSASPGSVPDLPSLAPGPITTFIPSTAPGLDRLRQANRSMGSSVASSFDIHPSNIHTYQWQPNVGAGGATPFHQGQEQSMDDATRGRPSEDSLAAWEAYAENMGYTLATNASMANTAPASPAMNTMSMTNPLAQMSYTNNNTHMTAPLAPSLSGAASAKGVPGQAVALMSSLFNAPTTNRKAPTGKPSKSSSNRASSNRSGTNSARMSIEEGDEEGQEDEGCPSVASARESVEVVGTPKRGSGTNAIQPNRYSNDAPQSATQLLNAAAAAAMASVSSAHSMGFSGPLSTTASDRPSGPVYVEAPEWADYLKTGDSDSGAGYRLDSDAVVAANARLSMQYQKAVAESAKTGAPIDPAWQTWVARIPEHHKPASGNTNAPA